MPFKKTAKDKSPVLKESDIDPEKLKYVKQGLCLFLPIVKHNGELWNYDEDGKWHITSKDMSNGMLLRKISQYCWESKREGIGFEKSELEFIRR